jgi:phytanoyl-CoA hydroxylase
MHTLDMQALRENFDRDGFVHIKEFMLPEEIDELESNINRFIRDVAPGLPKSVVMYSDFDNPASLKQIGGLEYYDPFFARLAEHPKLKSLAKSLLNDEIVPHGVQYFSKPPRLSNPTPPHQDGYYYCIKPNEAATIWMPLDDIDEENGAIVYVAGSHLKGVVNHNASYVLGFSQGITDENLGEFGNPVVCRVKRGDCLIHHSLMIHSAGANFSDDRNRRALSSVYFAKRAQVDPELERAYKESVERQREALLTE